jgi:hypothetical protein
MHCCSVRLGDFGIVLVPVSKLVYFTFGSVCLIEVLSAAT